MKKGAGKRKGNQFERKVCRQISEFWSDGKYSDLCWRSASSGARGTVSRTKVKGYHGDLVATSPLIESLFDIFCVEVKHYRDKLDITEIIRQNRFKKISNIRLIKFWIQTLGSSILSDRYPILIYKANFIPEILVCQRKLINEINKDIPKIIRKNVPFVGIGDNLMIFDFNFILQNINKDIFRRWVEIRSSER